MERVGNNPRIITAPTLVVVGIDREVKRFRVALLRTVPLGTDGNSHKIRKAVENATEGGTKHAYHTFDFDNQEAVIYVRDKTVPIIEWINLKSLQSLRAFNASFAKAREGNKQ